MINRLLPAYYFSLEGLLLYLLLFLLYFRQGILPSFPSFLGVLAATIVVLLFSLRQKQVSGAVPFIGAIVSGVIALLLSFTFMSVIFITVFMYFRIKGFYKDPTLWKNDRIKLAAIFYCSGLVIFLVGSIFKFPYMNWLFGIVIAFTILLSIGRYLQQIAGENTIRNMPIFSGILGVAFVLSAIITMVVPVFRGVFSYFFDGMAVVVQQISKPIFRIAEEVTLMAMPPAEDPYAEKDNELLFEAIESKEKVEMFSSAGFLSNVPIWVWGVLLVLGLIIFWLLLTKKKIVSGNISHKKSNVQLERTYSLSSTARKRTRREPEPNAYLRKLFYYLQTDCERYGFGRLEHETIREWFDRVGFQRNEELFIAYDSVRYGTKEIKPSEARHLEKAVQNIKREMKEKMKDDKGKEA
jgi:hypothetical protein